MNFGELPYLPAARTVSLQGTEKTRAPRGRIQDSEPNAASVPDSVAVSCEKSIENGVIWDQVVQIQADGVEEVYDLTVPVYHNFAANGFIVHNSIEQDADVVIFVYREDYYNEESEQQNIADLMVAKHRHGTTGTVSLYFRKELTQFRDLELRREDLDY